MSKSEFKRERRNDDAYRSNFDRIFGNWTEPTEEELREIWKSRPKRSLEDDHGTSRSGPYDFRSERVKKDPLPEGMVYDEVTHISEEELMSIAAGPPIFYEGAGGQWMWNCPACKETGVAPSPHLGAYDVPCACNRL